MVTQIKKGYLAPEYVNLNGEPFSIYRKYDGVANFSNIHSYQRIT